MPRTSKKYFHCTLPDCFDENGDPSPHYARGYCKHHYDMWRNDMQPAIRRDKRKYRMQSHCCRKDVQTGAQHEYGKQHCVKCGRPCLWKWVTI